MIPEIFIENWRKAVPWQMIEHIEQDLIISRALVELYNDIHVKDALVFRGGTALNKLFIHPPARYSEDIDFVQKNADPIGKTIDAIRGLLKPWLGDPNWKITQRSAKMIYKYESVNKIPAKLKIEINTTEHFQVLPFKTIPFSIDLLGNLCLLLPEFVKNAFGILMYAFCTLRFLIYFFLPRNQNTCFPKRSYRFGLV